MGYFNIFYKITRIIDMLTRKRNRKAIMVILIIIAVVFIYHNKVNAQEDDLQYNQSFTHSHIRLNSDGTVQYGTINTTAMYYSLIFPVKEGFTYKGSCTSSPSDAPLKVGFVSDLDNMIYTMNTIEGSTSINYGPGAVSIYGIYNALTGFEITADSDGYFIIGGFRPSGSAIGYQDCGFQVFTNYNGESNLNTINQDLLRIEDLLKDYLYGDIDTYTLSPTYFGRYTLSVNSDKKYVSSNDWSLYYLKLNKGYDYSFIFSENSSNRGIVRVGYANSIPTVNGTYDQFVLNNYIDTQGTYEISNYSLDYKYIVIALAFGNLHATSTYNPGQEEGIYGGLTNVDQQVQSQGQQTRDTITSTDYTQSDVAINSDSINNVDTTQTDGLFTTIFTNFNNSATGGVDSITIPLPYNSGNLVLYSNLVSSHLGALSTLVSAFWYFVFGFYAFKFVNNLLHNIKDGSILDGFKNNNEVITQDML